MTDFYEVSLYCASDRVGEVEEVLERANAFAITLRNGNVSERDSIVNREWTITQIIALLPIDADVAATEAVVKTIGCHSFRVRAIDKLEWAQKLKQPQIDLVVGPFVIGDPRPRVTPRQIPLKIAPGLAFGTGAHETTSLCLEWLAEQELSAKHVLDLGCGSGILAIAAMKLGAESVAAVDNDLTALAVTEENAAKNGVKILVTNRLQFENRFDLVVSNIYADTLVQYAEKVERVLKSNGVLALSGILKNQSEQVERSYANIRFNPVKLRNDWALLTGLKRS